MSLFSWPIFGSPSWKNAPIAPQLQELIDLCAEYELEVKITEVYRSAARQEKLYRQGRSSAGPIVTWTRQSAHIGGRAVDLTLVGAPEYEDDPEGWELLGLLGESVGLEWGGSYADYGHFELRG